MPEHNEEVIAEYNEPCKSVQRFVFDKDPHFWIPKKTWEGAEVFAYSWFLNLRC